MITAELIAELKSYYQSASTDHYAWTISVRTYNTLRYLGHIAKLCPPPIRKLRKCYMRKVYRLRQRERRRYGL